MSYHNVLLQHDMINTLELHSENGLSHEELTREVIAAGIRNKRIYQKDEVEEVLDYLIQLRFVIVEDDNYRWFEVVI